MTGMTTEQAIMSSHNVQDYFIDLEKFEQPMELHISIIVCIIIVSISGNASVIFFYTRQKPIKSSSIFILVIAFLDMFASLIVVPQFAFIKHFIFLRQSGDSRLRNMFFTMLIFVEAFYLTLLDCMAIDRVLAVFYPYAYKQAGRQIKFMISCAAGFSLIVAIVLPQLDMANESKILKTTCGVLIIASFAVIIVSYLAIIYRLNKHTQKVRHRLSEPKAKRNVTVTNIEGEIADKEKCLEQPTTVQRKVFG